MTFETPAIKLENLQKRFGAVTAVSSINLNIAQGQLYGLLGPNGAGKTTTLRMIAGLLKPDVGDVQILGQSITKQPKLAKQPLAYLPDDPLLTASCVHSSIWNLLRVCGELMRRWLHPKPQVYSR